MNLPKRTPTLSWELSAQEAAHLSYWYRYKESKEFNSVDRAQVAARAGASWHPWADRWKNYLIYLERSLVLQLGMY